MIGPAHALGITHNVRALLSNLRMVGQQSTGAIDGVVISVVSHEGLSISVHGRPGRLAILDEHGAIVAAGDDVADEVQAVAINGYRAFLNGQGFVRTRARLPLRSAGACNDADPALIAELGP